MYLSLLKKKIAFVEWRTVFRQFNTCYIRFYIYLFDYFICFFKSKRSQCVGSQLYDKNDMPQKW